MTFANNLDPDEAPQNVGLHLRSKLFGIQIIYRHKKLVGNKLFLQILKKKIFKKNLPSMQRVNNPMLLFNDVKEAQYYFSDRNSLLLSVRMILK